MKGRDLAYAQESDQGRSDRNRRRVLAIERDVQPFPFGRFRTKCARVFIRAIGDIHRAYTGALREKDSKYFCGT
jgi:hypothetical protein